MSQCAFSFQGRSLYLPLYLFACVGIALAIYYLPDYTFLEELTAKYSAGLSGLFGVHVHRQHVQGSVVLNGFRIVKDCTGVQVLAFLAGLLLPARNVPAVKKALMLSTASSGLLVTNAFRIAVQIVTYHLGILQWMIAHDVFGWIASVMVMFTLVVTYARLVPEFEEFLLVAVAWMLG